MMRVDAVVSAPLGLILVGSRPQPPRAARCGGHPRDSEAKVGLRLDLEPKTRTPPARLGRCARCGGQVVGRRSFPGDPPEWRCVQCGRSEVAARILTPEEQKMQKSRRYTNRELSYLCDEAVSSAHVGVLPVQLTPLPTPPTALRPVRERSAWPSLACRAGSRACGGCGERGCGGGRGRLPAESSRW